jgi:hypothetical protein
MDVGTSPFLSVWSRFNGVVLDYGQKEATEKKLLKDAFVKGDLWLRMGDLVKMDNLGYLCELRFGVVLRAGC